jgi:hypothetical protein
MARNIEFWDAFKAETEAQGKVMATGMGDIRSPYDTDGEYSNIIGVMGETDASKVVEPAPVDFSLLLSDIDEYELQLRISVASTLRVEQKDGYMYIRFSVPPMPEKMAFGVTVGVKGEGGGAGSGIMATSGFYCLKMKITGQTGKVEYIKLSIGVGDAYYKHSPVQTPTMKSVDGGKTWTQYTLAGTEPNYLEEMFARGFQFRPDFLAGFEL